MSINCSKIQSQYNKIYSYFKTTTEIFDFLDWDGKFLEVWYKNSILEKYSVEDLVEIGVL